jgi:hypothetical protein
MYCVPLRIILMPTFFIANEVEMRCCKRAPFSGWIAKLVLNGKSVADIVHSVMPDPIARQTWIVHLTPKAMAPSIKRCRPPMHYG